jgi:hypothetical protein
MFKKTGNVGVTWHGGAFVQPLLQWKSNKNPIFWVCVCSLSYLAWNVHAPYCHLWPVRLYNIFPYYLIYLYVTIFENSLSNIKCVFWYSLQLLFNTFLILRRNERDMVKNLYWSSCTVPAILVGFYWNLNFLDRFFEKSSSIKFHKIPSSGSQVVPWGRADGHDEANSRFSQFCQHA